MSTFNRLCAKAKRAVKKVSDKANELADSASRSVKIKALEIRIDEQYENLGRIVYRDLHTEENLEEMKLEIIAKIDALFDELEQIKAAKATRKLAKKEEPARECECDAEAAEEGEAPAEDAACECEKSVEECEAPAEEETAEKA